MVSKGEWMYQEGGLRHPDAVPIDITKYSKSELKEITKITGWWSDQGVLGIEVEHGSINLKGMCDPKGSLEPPHSASLKMADGEYITEIMGQTTKKIERLTFRTSRGTKITFGNDKPEGTEFRLFLKNHKVAAITVGIGQFMHFIGAYFMYSPSMSPPLPPLSSEFAGIKMTLEGEENKYYYEYPKAIGYENPKQIEGIKHLALENPETYGKFNDFEAEIKSQILDGKKVNIREIMLYYSTVKKVILGYRLKYEIRDPTKASGKILEIKHVASNPMTPTLHVVKNLEEKEFIVKVIGIRNKATEGFSYISMITNLGNVIEAGIKEKDNAELYDDFELEGKEEKNIIAFAGKVTDSLNAIGIYCIK